MKPSEFACADAQPHLPLLAGGLAGGPFGASATESATGPADGDLEPALAASVRAHATSCANCAAELQRIESALEALASVRDERQLEVDLWSGIRSELVSSGVLRSGAIDGAVVAGSASATSSVPSIHARSWTANVRRWSVAAGFFLAFGTAGFFVSHFADNGIDPAVGGPSVDGPNVAADLGSTGTDAVSVARNDSAGTTNPSAVPTTPVALGGLRRATLEEQRQFLRPAQVFNAQTRNASSSGVVAGDVRLR